MEFENMKKIWDAQNNEHLYAIDEYTLHSRVIKNRTKVKKMANISEWGMLVIMLALALAMIIEGILDNELYQLPEGALLFVVVGYIYRGRRKRLKYEGQTDRTLLGDLEQAIRMINFHIKRQKNFFWWFIMPLVGTNIIHFVYTFNGKPWWLWPLGIVFFVYSYLAVEKELRDKIIPQKEELESLKNLLVGTVGIRK